MDVTQIPFVKKVGITHSTKGELKLPFSNDSHNHLATIHASAQFTLAETASGEYLQTLFPELAGGVIPVLRAATIKFKKPAVKTILAYPSITDESVEKFKTQFYQKGRASITVDVEIKDIENTLTCISSYNWFVQKVEP